MKPYIEKCWFVLGLLNTIIKFCKKNVFVTISRRYIRQIWSKDFNFELIFGWPKIIKSTVKWMAYLSNQFWWPSLLNLQLFAWNVRILDLESREGMKTERTRPRKSRWKPWKTTYRKQDYQIGEFWQETGKSRNSWLIR